MSLNILVVNSDVPPPDRDSGSLRLFRIIQMMVEMGHRVTVLGREGINQAAAVRSLLATGVENVIPVDADRMAARYPQLATALATYPKVDIEGLLTAGRFDVAWLSFHHVARQYVPLLRQFSPGTRVVVDSVDVHWVRELRGAQLTNDAAGIDSAEITRQQERSAYSSADLNVAVTDADAEAIRELAPDVPVLVVPNIHPTPSGLVDMSSAKDVIFIGNFNHRPNVDAITWFCNECWPHVRLAQPQATLTIVGTDPPPEVTRLSTDQIEVTGWVPEVEPYLRRARVSIAPLRYGAGMKGKVGEALAAGVPVVSTTIGAEGMGLEHLTHALIADDPVDFARGVVRLMEDDVLAKKLVAAAADLISETAGAGTALNRIAAVLNSVAPPRWQAEANTPNLAGLLAAYAETFTSDDRAELVLTLDGGGLQSAEALADRVTGTLTQLNLRLDEMADIEITHWSSDHPTPRRTLFWDADAEGVSTTHRPVLRSVAHSPTRFVIGTIASSSYLPWVRVLADSVRQHHPELSLTVLLLDEPDPSWLRSDDSFELRRLSDLLLNPAERAWMELIYSPFELSCALKPWLLELLLQEAEAALYLDADMLILGPLTDVFELAVHHGLVLTPHGLSPLPDDGCFPTDATFLEYGQFNAGFVATGRGGKRFLDFWKGKLRRDCVDRGAAESYVVNDQRWLDLAAGYFPLSILRDPGVNVGYWNLGPREVALDGESFKVGDHDLRLMHFSGFDPRRPDVLSRHPGNRARAATASPAVRQLASDYAQRLLEAGWSERTGGNAAVAGMLLTQVVRRSIRIALKHAEAQGSLPAELPTSASALLSWLMETADGTSLPRYVSSLRLADQRFAATFPNVPGEDEQKLVNWLSQGLQGREFLPEVLADALV